MRIKFEQIFDEGATSHHWKGRKCFAFQCLGFHGFILNYFLLLGYFCQSIYADGRRGSNVYEVNTWLWLFACGKPSLGGLSVEETALKKKAVREDQAKRSVETRRRRKAAKA